jgi:hypothetical protein
MSAARISGALLETLGAPASAELMEVLNSQQRASTEAVMTHCQDRFERRLVEEMSKVRVDLAQLRGETQEGFANTRAEIATSRFELLRWAFGFWVAQLVGVAGIVGVLLHSLSAR